MYRSKEDSGLDDVSHVKWHNPLGKQFATTYQEP